MNTQLIRAAAVCATLALTSQASSAELTLPKDGWASWQVDAVEGAPSWCCWRWNERDAPRASCNLDRDGGNFGSRDHATTDAVRVYARLAGGKVERLRVLSASCQVETATPIQADQHDHGRQRALVDRAIEEERRGKRRPARASARRASRCIAATSRTTNWFRSPAAMAPIETRKRAVFWLAHVRGVAGAEVATDLMFNDKDSELRKHAAFAITQSKSPRIAADLIRLGNTDKDGDVRAQAWFWLAHTGAANAEGAIVAALKKDEDDHVREQAIFALSQLPDERATRALIAAAEDQSLSH